MAYCICCYIVVVLNNVEYMYGAARRPDPHSSPAGRRLIGHAQSCRLSPPADDVNHSASAAAADTAAAWRPCHVPAAASAATVANHLRYSAVAISATAAATAAAATPAAAAA